MSIRLFLLFLSMSIANFGYAESPDSLPGASLVGIRLGVHPGTTRIVFDFSGPAPIYRVGLDPTGQALTLSLESGSQVKAGIFPQGGLVAAIGLQAQSTGTLLQIALTDPVQVAAQGVLPPNAVYRHHRLYLDLVAAVPMPVTDPEAVTERRNEARSEALAMPPQAPREEAASAEEHAEASEAAATHFKLGAAGDRSFKGGKISEGPAVAIQTGILRDQFELEASGTALFDHGHPEWKTGLLLKKPIELAPQFEIEIGLGPSWLRKTAGDHPGDSLGAEGVGELVVWNNEEKRFGWYFEGSYGRDFGKGHESGTGFGTGLLIAVP